MDHTADVQWVVQKAIQLQRELFNFIWFHFNPFPFFCLSHSIFNIHKIAIIITFQIHFIFPSLYRHFLINFCINLLVIELKTYFQFSSFLFFYRFSHFSHVYDGIFFVPSLYNPDGSSGKKTVTYNNIMKHALLTTHTILLDNEQQQQQLHTYADYMHGAIHLRRRSNSVALPCLVTWRKLKASNSSNALKLPHPEMISRVCYSISLTSCCSYFHANHFWCVLN